MKKTKYYFILLMCSIALVSACSKDDDSDDNNTPAPTPVTVNSPPQVSGNINGVNFNYVTGGLNPYQSSVGYDSGPGVAFPPDSCHFTLLAGFENVLTGQWLWDFRIGTYDFVLPSDSVSFKNFFEIKPWSYGVTPMNGMEIVYYDASGDMWSTSYGSANQTGSTFQLQAKKFIPFQGEKYERIKATFNCKLYNASGAVKVVTNGVVVADFWLDY